MLPVNLHLDFHNPEFVESLGTRFNANHLIGELKRRGISSITFCAKDHHGNSYYFTTVGHQHPHLRVDMLRDVIEAAHHYGLKVFAYYSVIWDEWAAQQNPEWLQVDASGNRIEANVEDFSRRWSFLCLNSPYTQELLQPQLEELLTQYSIDGLWLDILRYYHDACLCPHCLHKFASRLDLETADGRKSARTQTVMEFVRNTTALIRTLRPEIWVTYNSVQNVGKAYRLRNAIDYFTVEALPDEGGYLFPSALVRYLRNIRRPVEGIVVTFHRSWGDFGSIKHLHQLLYELATMVANGCERICLGDQLLPTGELETYRLNAYASVVEFFQRRAEYLTEWESVREVAVLVPEDLDSASSSVQFPNDALAGASQFFVEEHYQFDIIDQRMVADQFFDLEQCQIIVLPDCAGLQPKVAEQIGQYVENGGAVLGTCRSVFALPELFGIAFHSWSPFEQNYLHFPYLLPGVPAANVVGYSDFAQVILQSDEVEVIAWLRYPMKARKARNFYGHRQAPPDQISSFPAVTICRYGKGVALYIATSLFADYYRTGLCLHRDILRACMRRLYPNRKVQAIAPTAVEVTVMRQPLTQRLLVHLVNCHAMPRGHRQPEPITEFPTWKNIRILVDLAKVCPEWTIKRVYAVPSSMPVVWRRKKNKIEILIPEFRGIHSVITVE